MDDDNEIEGNHWGVNEDDKADPDISPQEEPESKEKEGSGGISPIIGYLLMVSVTVIIIAIVGTVVIDITESVASNDTPKPQVDVNKTSEELVINISEIPTKYDYITVKGPNKQVRVVSDREVTFENPPENPTITVTGIYTDVRGLYGTEEKTNTVLLYNTETGNRT